MDGVKGVKLPPSAGQYCSYIDKGYFGYTWQKSAGGFDKFPCPKSAKEGNNGQGDTLFCTISNGQLNVTFPAGIKADCDGLAQGRFGWIG
jgi:hypothetical protein